MMESNRRMNNQNEDNPKVIQLMKQSFDAYYEVEEGMQRHRLDGVRQKLENIALGKAAWKKIFLRDTMWNAKSEIEIITNPVHMAIIIGDEDLALQILERWKIAYENDEVIELARFSTIKEKVFERFTIIDVFAAFASKHRIWVDLLSRLYKNKSFVDDVIFNNIFMRYKGEAFFSLSEERKKMAVENMHIMECAVPHFFDDSEIAIGCGGTWGLSGQMIALQKLSVCMEALQGSESVMEKMMEIYFKDFTFCMESSCDTKVLCKQEMKVLLEDIEKRCQGSERLEQLFFGFLLVAVARQNGSLFVQDRSDEEQYRNWLKEKNANYNMTDYYNLVKDIQMSNAFATRITNVFNSLIQKKED